MRGLTGVQISTLSALLLLIDAGSTPGSYFPMQVGNTWTYEGAITGLVEVRQMDPPFSIWGTEVSVLRVVESPFNLGLKNYWTSDSTGTELLLWGADRDIASFRYSPPIPYLRPPFELGNTWSTTTTILSPDSTVLRVVSVRFEISHRDTITVGARDYLAWGVSETLIGPQPKLPMFSLLGETMSGPQTAPDSGEPPKWWAQGVGQIRYLTSDRYELQSFDITPIQNSSWGSLKRLFRVPKQEE